MHEIFVGHVQAILFGADSHNMPRYLVVSASRRPGINVHFDQVSMIIFDKG